MDEFDEFDEFLEFDATSEFGCAVTLASKEDGVEFVGESDDERGLEEDDRDKDGIRPDEVSIPPMWLPLSLMCAES